MSSETRYNQGELRWILCRQQHQQFQKWFALTDSTFLSHTDSLPLSRSPGFIISCSNGWHLDCHFIDHGVGEERGAIERQYLNIALT
jgi:hypothetical protein